MKAIQTRYLGPTNFKGARIKAWADGWNAVVIPYDHGSRSEHAHYKAACELMERRMRYGFKPDTMVYGILPNGDYVFCDRQNTIKEKREIAV